MTFGEKETKLEVQKKTLALKRSLESSEKAFKKEKIKSRH